MLKINQILVGTHNSGKFKEISNLLPRKIKKISPTALKIASPRETGKTFLQNSILKAKYFYKKSKIVSISDDSGLEIASMNKRPGIKSARFAKKNGGFKRAMQKILKILKNKKNRKATFVCSLSIKVNNKKTISALGKVNGTISYKILGKKGFGYDPIFIPKNKTLTFGQMSPKKKFRIDHRFIAFKKLKKKL
ncbi:MAG: RdgB/HAM1 family non-canonical purine NTP pyrophosphatase [Pseudomonadota bacterium]|nr:RdgB/HAM1 family non-canonical purine NTP pyrophosphatase [Pseudomonadota bacterium]